MAFDCYFVRLSFDLKDGRAARANGAYADSTTKTNGFNQFFKLCFCAGERRGEQNTHGSDKKTHATKALKKLCFLALLVSFFRSRHPNRKKVPKMTSQSPSGTLPGTRLEGKIGLLVALGAFQGRFWTSKGPKWHPKSLKNRPRRPRPAQERPRAAGRPKKTPPGGPNSRPSEAHKHTKKLYENTGQKVFPNRFTQDPPTILGSVAGIGGAAWLPLASSGFFWPCLAWLASRGLSRRVSAACAAPPPWPPLASPGLPSWLPVASPDLLWPPLAVPGLPWPPLVAARGLP